MYCKRLIALSCLIVNCAFSMEKKEDCCHHDPKVCKPKVEIDRQLCSKNSFLNSLKNCDLGALKLSLESKKYDVNTIVDVNKNYTALHALLNNRYCYLTQNDYDLVAALVQYEIALNARAHNGETPLFLLVGTNKFTNDYALKIAELFIQKKIDLNIKDQQNKTVLYKAANKGDEKLVRKIVRAGKGADPNIANHKGSTALHKAVRRGYVTIARYLLELGAGYTHANNKGKIPQKMAEEKNRSEILKLIAQREKLKKGQEDKKNVASEAEKLKSGVDENGCPVCFYSIANSEAGEVITLGCGHTFHKACVKSCKLCPMCRNPFTIT